MFFIVLVSIILIIPLTQSQIQSIYVDPLVKNDNNFTGNSTYSSLSSAINAAKALSVPVTVNLVSPRIHEISQDVVLSSSLTLMQDSSQTSTISFTDNGFLKVSEGRTLKIIFKNMIILTTKANYSAIIIAHEQSSLILEVTLINFIIIKDGVIIILIIHFSYFIGLFTFFPRIAGILTIEHIKFKFIRDQPEALSL